MIHKIIFPPIIPDFEAAKASHLADQQHYDLYWRKTQSIQPRELSFKKGLNILVGPNGSGKSTTLDYIASWLAAKEGGYSCVTKNWVYNLWEDTHWDHRGPKLKGTVEHSGEPILYFSSQRNIGMVGSANWPQDAFMSEGMEKLKRTGSHGQLRLMDLTKLYSTLQGDIEFPKKIKNRGKDVHWKGGDYTKRVEDSYFKATGKVKAHTILMDEPEAGLDLVEQFKFWDTLKGITPKSGFQIIIATHNPLALNITGAHYIEMQPGYPAHTMIGEVKYADFN